MYPNLVSEDDDDMGDQTRINSPDVHHHYQNKPAAERLAKSDSVVADGKVGKLAKAAIVAGLIGSGAGVGVGVPMMIGYIKDKLTTEVKVPVPGDTERFDWRLGSPVLE